MIVRAVVVERAPPRRPRRATARAFASVRPTWAYSGSVKLPIGLTWSPKRHGRAAHGVGGRHEAVVDGLRDQHQAAGDVAGGEDVRRGGPQDRRRPARSRARSVSTPAVARLSPSVSATQPTATTTTAASAWSRAPSFEKTIRTPPGVFSKRSIAPKSSRTTMPARGRRPRPRPTRPRPRSSGCAGRPRRAAPASRSALKIDATCTPVRAGADDEHRRRHRGQAPGVAVGRGQLEPGDRQPPARAARAEDDPVGLERQPALGRDRVRIDEPGGAGVLVDRRRPGASRSGAQGRVGAHVADDLADAGEEARDSPAPARRRRCRTERAGAPRGAAGRRGRASAPAPARRWPPCRRTRRG